MHIKHFICLLLLYVNILYSRSLVFDSRYSTIKVNDNASFQINNPIPFWNGTLLRSSAGTITGDYISFVDGLLEDAGNQILLNAIFDPAGIIRLIGNSTFNAQPGYILQSIDVSGPNNLLMGQPIFFDDINLADSATTLTIAIQSQANKNIHLNGGTLVLNNDLVFTDSAIVLGDGEVHGNRYTLHTGGEPFTWTSNINWFTNIDLNTCVSFTGSFTFNAPNNNIRGNGYVYDLTGGGVLTVASGKTLTLVNVVIKGLGDSAGCGRIILEDDTATLVLTNVTLLFCDDFTMSQGVVEVKGPTTAVVKDHFWHFNGTSLLQVDCLTLWKDVAGASPCGDITFASGANLSLMNDATIEYISLKCTSIIENIDSILDLLESCCEITGSRLDDLDSRVDLLESCCEVTGSELDVIDSRLDLLESCCEVTGSEIDNLDSRVDLLESCCEVTGSELDVIDSRLDLLESCCEVTGSEIDNLDSRVDLLESCCEVTGSELDVIDSRLDLLESCCEVTGSEIDNLDSRLDLLESCCEVTGSILETIDSRLDLLESCCEVTGSEIDNLDSRVDLLESCCEVTGSELDVIDSRLDLLESCCEVTGSILETIDSRLDLLESCCEVTGSELDVIDSRLDLLESCCEVTGSRLDLLESCCEVTGSEIDNLDSRVDLLESCCEVNDSRIDLLESCCEFNSSRIDVIESIIETLVISSDAGLISRIELLESCCEVTGSRLDLLESCCEVTGSEIDNLDSRVDLLESCCEVNDSRIDLLESCCEFNGSRIDVLESEIDTIIISSDAGLISRIELLESCCEATGSRLDLLESCCEVTGSEIDNLDSRVDLLESCCEVNDSRIDLLESCCEFNGSRIDVLESEIDTIIISSDAGLISRIELLESCCEVTGSRLDLLESCCEATGSEIDNLDSRVDLLESCCEFNSSRIDVLESEIDTIIISSDAGLISRIELLESCCEATGSRLDLLESCCEFNSSRIDVLESEIEIIESRIDVIVTATCEIKVCGDLFFTLPLLPAEDETVIFRFDECCVGACGKENAPRVIFDPAVFGNMGRVVLPKGSRLVFCGFGNVEIKDGVVFEYTGTPCLANPPQSDWPEILLDDTACMILDAGATAMIGGGMNGAGCFNLRKGGAVVLDQPNSHLIFGEDENNEIIVNADFGSHITVDNASALLSFQLGVFDLLFNNHSAFQILMGTAELNKLQGNAAPGYIRRWEFNDDSCLIIPGQCGKTLGVLCLAPNLPNHPCGGPGSENVMFNNLAGNVCGNGDLQYVAFDAMGNKIVNTVTQIQNNHFCLTAPMVEIFFNLSYIIKKGLIPPPDSEILALHGSRPQSKCGRLIAFCPTRDGRAVCLAQGDHDVFYNSTQSCGPLNQVCGYDRSGRVFCITNCDESTRVPPAPPTCR